MVDFVTHTDAIEALKPFKLDPGDLDFAAQLLRFFSHPASFTYALEHVSAALWERYRHLEKDAPNRLSRIIGAEAFHMGFRLTSQPAQHENDGKLEKPGTETPKSDGLPEKTAARKSEEFKPGDRVTLRLVAKDLKFLDLIKEGLVWKDSMDLRHGEWSHALQWLAATDYLGARVPVFYRQVVPNHSAGGLSLWSMLCDAFPLDIEDTKHPAQFKMQTDGFRSPQNVSRLLFGSSKPVAGHFLSHELTNHYLRRNLLEFKKTSHGEVLDVKQTPSRSREAPGWKLDPGNAARHQLTSLPEKKLRAARVTDGQTMTFHQVPGQWYPRV
jgi:hypothetical protein